MGLANAVKALAHEDTYIVSAFSDLSQVLGKNSKLVAVRAEDGGKIWERWTTKQLGDIFSLAQSKNLALVLDELQQGLNSRIVEYPTYAHIHRLNLATGEKDPSYSAIYPRFRRREAELLPSEDTIVLLGEASRLATYPNTQEGQQRVAAARKEVTHYELSRSRDILVAYKADRQVRELVPVWNISVSRTKEKILAFVMCKRTRGNPRPAIQIAERTFRRLQEPYRQLTMFLSGTRRNEEVMKLYIVDSYHGAIYDVSTLYTKIPVVLPMLAGHDNAVAIGLHYEGKVEDKIVLVEACESDQIVKDYSKDEGRQNPLDHEIEILFPIRTTLEFEWRLTSLDLVWVERREYIAAVDEKGRLHMIQIDALARGMPQRVGPENSRVFELKEPAMNGTMRQPTRMVYNEKAQTMLLLGVDIYAFKLA